MLEKRLERILNVGHALDHLVLLIFPTAVIAIAREFSIPYETLLPLTFGCFVAFGVGSLPAGWLAHRYGRRPLMLLFFFGTGLSCIAVGLVTTPWQIGVTLTVMGVFSAIYHPVGYAVLSGLDPARMGKIMGVNGLYGNLGVAFAALVTGAITEWISWRAAFVLPGLACLVAGAVYFVVTRGVPQLEPHALTGSVRTRREMMQVLLIFAVLAILGCVIFTATTVVMPKLFEQELPALPSGTFGVGLIVCLVFSIAALAQALIGALLDRFSLRAILIPVTAIQIPLLFLVAHTQDWLLVAVAAAMMFSIFGQAPIGEVIVARYAPADIRARFNAVRFAVLSGIGATAIPLAAQLYGLRQDFSLLFYVLAALAVGVFGVALLFPRDQIAAQTAPAE